MALAKNYKHNSLENSMIFHGYFKGFCSNYVFFARVEASCDTAALIECYATAIDENEESNDFHPV